MSTEFALPALKENVEMVEVNALKVAIGDIVVKDQPLMEVQADKAALEVPSPVSGKVTKILVKVGDQIKIGQIYIALEVSESTSQPEKSKPLQVAPKSATLSQAGMNPAAPPKQALVRSLPPEGRLGGTIVASPGVRRLARDMGIDLSLVATQSGTNRVNEDDLKAFVKQIVTGGGSGSGPVLPNLPRFEDHGSIERMPLNAIRRATAKHMALCWSQIPHVTENELADITDLEAFRKSQDSKGPKITVTAFVLKALAVALNEFPQFNSSLDLTNSQIILKKYIHIGVAVDTEGGLLVPVLRDVDKKSVVELATEVNSIAERARGKKLSSTELTGGTFTLTNLGGIGGTGFTPIVNWPEVAILGLSRGRVEFVAIDNKPVPRLMMPLSLSFDHRVVDGAQAARFLRRVVGLLEDHTNKILHS